MAEGAVSGVNVVRDAYLEAVFQKLLQAGDQALVQVWFRCAVLDRYGESSAYSVIRTDTIGRINRQRVWSLDFGIAQDGSLIHASLGDLLLSLPQDERKHWAEHAVALPASLNFLKTRMAPGGCLDDGELRNW